MPERETFDSEAAYYATLLHEMTHSTGHESRLARPGVPNPIRYGSHEYSQEELVAEMGAAFLLAEARIAWPPPVASKFGPGFGRSPCPRCSRRAP